MWCDSLLWHLWRALKMHVGYIFDVSEGEVEEREREREKERRREREI